jgi:formamidopyrimidine-DNA glycosylase
VLGDAIDHYEQTVGEELPDKLPMPLRSTSARASPAPLRHDDRGRLLRRAPDQLLPQEQTGGRVLKDRRLSRLLK